MIRRTLALLAAVVVGIAALAAPALAHDDQGLFSVTVSEPSGDLAYDLQVALIYSGDREPVEGANVTAVAEGPGGTAGPFTLEPTEEPGSYATTVTFPAPGEWTVRFTSITPSATIEHPIAVAAPATTTTDAPTTTTNDQSTSTIELVEEEEAAADDGGISPALVIAALVVASAIVAVVLGLRQSR